MRRRTMIEQWGERNGQMKEPPGCSVYVTRSQDGLIAQHVGARVGKCNVPYGIRREITFAL